MAMQLDEHSATPLYAQLMDALKTCIDDGTYRPGARIPSEEKLNELYGVSRITIRRALKELVDQGYLVKRMGKGTYVSQDLPAATSKVETKFAHNNEVEGFTQACESNGRRAGAQLFACRKVPGLDDERDFFGFGAEGHLLCVERVRTADGEPIMVEENYFPYDTYRFLEQANFTDTSLYEIVATGRQVTPMLKEPCALNIEKATADIASLLEVPEGEPLFCLSGRYYDSNGDAMYLGKQHIVGSRYTFRI